MTPQPPSSATHKGQRAYQEDRLLAVATQEGVLLCVFDGHGGDECSNYAVNRYPIIFASEITQEGATPGSAVEKSIQKLNIETQHMGPGSTMSLVFIPANSDTATCAVIGDSPIIIRDADGKVSIGGAQRPHQLRGAQGSRGTRRVLRRRLPVPDIRRHGIADGTRPRGHAPEQGAFPRA